MRRAGARAVRVVTRPRRVVSRLTRFHAAVLRASGGRVRRSRVLAHGQPVLSLTTIGRRSGAERSTVVAYAREGDAYVLFGMNLGSERDPAWCLNLAANPAARIDVDGRSLPVGARRAEGDEARRLWDAYVARMPAVAPFAEIAGREIPIFLLIPG